MKAGSTIPVPKTCPLPDDTVVTAAEVEKLASISVSDETHSSTREMQPPSACCPSGTTSPVKRPTVAILSLVVTAARISATIPLKDNLVVFWTTAIAILGTSALLWQDFVATT